MAPEQIVGAGISQCPEGRGIFSQLSVKENLLIGAYLRSDNEIEKDIQSIYEMFPILEERSKQAAGNLSGGEQMMLALSRSLMSRPKLLILDEPSLGLAPLVIETIFDMLKKINVQGITILIVEQNAVMALELSHRAYVLETGRMVLSGQSTELASNPQVQKAYLGGE
jgi:branched-chain amino acid transport system ATP-binding protein